MIRITVAQSTVKTIPYTDKKGQPARLFAQTAYAHTVDREGNPPAYPEKIEILLDKHPVTGEPVAYPPGEYTLHPSAIFVDRNGRLQIASQRLAPLKSAATAASPTR